MFPGCNITWEKIGIHLLISPSLVNSFTQNLDIPTEYAKFSGGNSSPQTPEIFDLSTKQEPETPYSLLRLQFVKYSIYAQINCYLS